MKFLVGTRGENYSRDRAVRATGLSERTIDRALSGLISVGAIVRQRGGRDTSSKITVLKDLPGFLAHQVRMAHQVPQNGALSVENGAPNERINISEERIQSKESPHVFSELTDEELSLMISMGNAPDAEVWTAIEKQRAANRQQEHGIQREAGAGAGTPRHETLCCPLATRRDTSDSLALKAGDALDSRRLPPRKPPDRHGGFLAEQIRQLVNSKSLSRRRYP